MIEFIKINSRNFSYDEVTLGKKRMYKENRYSESQSEMCSIHRKAEWERRQR